MRKLAICLLILAIIVGGCTKRPTDTSTPILPSNAETETFEVISQIGGPTQAVAIQGNYTYIGVGPRLVILDVANPSNLREVGSTLPFGGLVESITLGNGVAYVACGSAGLNIIDTVSPNNPTLVTAYNTQGYIEAVAIAGKYAYICDGPVGVRVLDVTNPAKP
ncbi:MAG: hypothetical protein JXB43_02560 [Dehalococcoidia bacterium]|nr:hypothetical protein [Dehalococcoidia bacterium]